MLCPTSTWLLCALINSINFRRASFLSMLSKQLQQNNLLAKFLRLINGCIDTLKLARKMFKKEDVGNYKQQNLAKKLIGKSYEAHDALEDVKSLHEFF
jgi:DNA polymerase III alpha subunit (gram-positive type)